MCQTFCIGQINPWSLYNINFLVGISRPTIFVGTNVECTFFRKSQHLTSAHKHVQRSLGTITAAFRCTIDVLFLLEGSIALGNHTTRRTIDHVWRVYVWFVIRMLNETMHPSIRKRKPKSPNVLYLCLLLMYCAAYRQVHYNRLELWVCCNLQL